MHHTLHPTCEEIHNVILLSFFSSVFSSLWKWYMTTVSTIFLSLVSKRNLVVSSSSIILFICKLVIEKFLSKLSLSDNGNMVISSKQMVCWLKTSLIICFIRKGWIFFSCLKDSRCFVSRMLTFQVFMNLTLRQLNFSLTIASCFVFAMKVLVFPDCQWVLVYACISADC